jgi:hypothetical protein
MIKRLTLTALALFTLAGAAAAAELAPGDGQSVHLGGYEGVVYYTVEQDGYRVVTTLASGADQQPVRFVSTLAPGQHLVVSVPQFGDQPPLDFEISRTGGSLTVSDLVADEATSTIASMRTGVEQ